MTTIALNTRPITRVGLPVFAGAAVAAVALALNAAGRAHPAQLHALLALMPSGWMVLLGAASGAGAGLLAGLIGIGGGIVVVPAVYYGLVASGLTADQAAHVAISTSLATILPAAVVSSFGHWRAGHTDISFLRSWGPGVVAGVVAAQLAAPHLRGSLMTGAFALLCLVFAARFAFPSGFRQVTERPPGGVFCGLAGLSIGLFSGLAGVGGGIMTNVVMRLSGLSMHKCVGRAAAVGVVVSVPAVIVAALGPGPHGPTQLGSIDVAAWALIAPTQAAAAWFGARLARHIGGDNLSRVMAAALLATGAVMLRSSL
ncbi:MAG TPA: sulfite exporter TauE/SafE family protein [Stellaceae bacterium]|nr:sulfite exporter TauE/SafE family protein [Stellaceae bacterium]